MKTPYRWWQTLITTKRTASIRTVRYMFPIILSIIAILGASVITSSNTSYIELVPSQTLVMSGEQFYIDVFAYAHVPVNALDISIQFLPGSVEIIGFDIGESVLTIWTQEPMVNGDLITLGGGTYRRGFMGEHKVATINVRALHSGKTEFMVNNAELLAGDGLGTPVVVTNNVEKAKKSFVIYDQNEDPAKISADLGVNITADIDGDGEVTLSDVSAFMSAWYSNSATYDFNNDNRMNFIDFSIILARSFFGETG